MRAESGPGPICIDRPSRPLVVNATAELTTPCVYFIIYYHYYDGSLHRIATFFSPHTKSPLFSTPTSNPHLDAGTTPIHHISATVNPDRYFDPASSRDRYKSGVPSRDRCGLVHCHEISTNPVHRHEIYTTTRHIHISVPKTTQHYRAIVMHLGLPPDASTISSIIPDSMRAPA